MPEPVVDVFEIVQIEHDAVVVRISGHCQRMVEEKPVIQTCQRVDKRLLVLQAHMDRGNTYRGTGPCCGNTVKQALDQASGDNGDHKEPYAEE